MGVTYKIELESSASLGKAEELINLLGGGVSAMEEDCWFDTYEVPGQLPVVTIGCTSGAFTSGILESVVRELCKRLPVRRVGSDSAGWFNDGDFGRCESLRDSPADNWVDYMRAWRPEQDNRVWAAIDLSRGDQYRRDVSDAIAKAFAEQVDEQEAGDGV